MLLLQNSDSQFYLNKCDNKWRDYIVYYFNIKMLFIKKYFCSKKIVKIYGFFAFFLLPNMTSVSVHITRQIFTGLSGVRTTS